MIEQHDNLAAEFELYYMNGVQMLASIIDPNMLYAEWGRATGKTEGVMGPRLIRVANDMPGELSFLVHKTYVALMTNVWPNIQAYFSRPVIVNGRQRAMLEYGVDYVVGETRLPSHFRLPRYPVSYAKHSVIFRNGAHLQLVSSDQPESVAGRNAVHAFIEEMKHNSGEKLKSRLFPSLRGGSAEIRKSAYYEGVTGVSDTARVDLGEDDWFEDYEQGMNRELIEEIASVSLAVNKSMYRQFVLNREMRKTKNPVAMERIRLEQQQLAAFLARWRPRLADMRRNAVYYIRASSFRNKDILGPKFFKTQLDTLDMDEFLTAICGVRHKEVTNKFFAAYDKARHQFKDSYVYDAILGHDLKDKFTLTARYLRHYDRREPLYVGYDPGAFSSMVVGQKKDYGRQLDIIKEFWAYYPEEQESLAQQFYQFFGADAQDRVVHLYPDRAGNKRREELEQITTDSRALKAALEGYGFSVILHNEGAATIYHWQQFKLCLMLFGEQRNFLPRVRICENECKNLCSAILISPLVKKGNSIELDKSSEKKEPLKRQAGLTTQLPSAMIYLLYGLYGDIAKSDLSTFPTDLPDNTAI
nr:MAG TPA: large terminase [Caudoviricetes sp.]